MSVYSDINTLSPDTAAFIVRVAAYHYLDGAATALFCLGDHDRTEFSSFLYGYFRGASIKSSKDFHAWMREFKFNGNQNGSIDFRGLVCCIMDDLGIRDVDLREGVLSRLVQPLEG